MPELQTYYIMANFAGAVFVKGEKFFIAQGGKDQDWGKKWIPVKAESIEDARALGKALLEANRLGSNT